MIEYPPRLAGTPQEQLRQLWEYLYKLAEKLNVQEQEAEHSDNR